MMNSIPIGLLLLALTALQTTSSLAVAASSSADPTFVGDGRRHHVNVDVDVDAALGAQKVQIHEPSANQMHQHERSLQSMSMSMCSCSPTIFHVRFDFSKDCSTDTIKANDGIRNTLCILGEAGNPPSPPSPVVPTPIPTTPNPITENDDMFFPPRPPTPADGGLPTYAPTPVGTLPTYSPTPVGSTDDDGTSTAMPSPSTGTLPTTDVGTTSKPTTYGPTPTYTYLPTDAWPTYSPTKANNDNDSIEPLLSSSAALPRNKDEDSPSLLERYHGYTHSQVYLHDQQHQTTNIGMNMMAAQRSGGTLNTNGNDNNVPSPAGTAGGTYYPTDDQTYEPTTDKHARNLKAHLTTRTRPADAGVPAAAAGSSTGKHLNRNRRQLVEEWASIPPNDGFFHKYPEWRESQSVIYQMKNQMKKNAGGNVHNHHRTLFRTNRDGHDTNDAGPEAEASIVDIPFTTNDQEEADVGVDVMLYPNVLLSAQFLELDTSSDMNIINQDDQYINVTFPPNNDPITDYTLSFTSISSMLDTSVPLEDQLEMTPGGVILILVGVTEEGEIVRNRIMWMYGMGCDGEESVVIEKGDAFGWTMFVSTLAYRQLIVHCFFTCNILVLDWLT